MKHEYKIPEMEVIEMVALEIITTSGGEDDGFGGLTGGDTGDGMFKPW